MNDPKLNKIRDWILSVYQEGFHFLESINVSDHEAYGTFTIPEKQYITSPARALSGTSMLILFSQACIVSSAAKFASRSWKEATDFKLDINKFDVKNYGRKLAVSKFKNVHYRKPVTLNSEKRFKLTFKKMIDKYQSRGFILFEADFDINDGAQTASARFCLSKEKAGYSSDED